MKADLSALTKPPWKAQQAISTDFQESRSLLLLIILMTVATFVFSIGFGVFQGGFHDLLLALTVAGVVSLIYWFVTLVFLIPLALFEYFHSSRWLDRQARRDSKAVLDEWLDGPC